MKLSLKLVLAAGLLQPLCGLPAPAAQAQPQTDAHYEQALALVEILHPFDQMLALNLKGWEMTAQKTFALDPGMAKLEAQYPGAIKAAMEAARPHAREFCVEFVRRATKLKAETFSRRLTPAEIGELRTFYGTPAGKRIVATAYANMNLEPIAAQIASQAQNGEAEISSAQLKQVEQAALRKTVGEISADDQLAAMRFGQKPVATKFLAVREESERALLELANSPDPATIAKQREAAAAGVIAFVERSKAK
jgi:hypothetical protein